MADTAIEWTDRVWNPTVGCSIRSPGCTNCYAMKLAHRLALMGQEKYAGLTTMTKTGPVWNGVVRLDPDSLDAPLHWKKPKRIFVNSMSDLAHEDLATQDIDKVFDVMHRAHWHTFQPLTKREDGLLAYAKDFAPRPLRNVHVGLSIEDEPRLKLRGPVAAEVASLGWFTWFSVEPLLEGIDLSPYLARPGKPGARWVVVGGESGHRARPFGIQWARDIVAQCKDAGVPVFVKQLGAKPFETDVEYVDGLPCATSSRDIRLKDRSGGEQAEWPEDLRVREFPA